VKILPEDGLLSFGGVLQGESCEKTFRVVNVSSFAVKFKLTSLAGGVKNQASTKVYSFIP